jgi:hypothetical protein
MASFEFSDTTGLRFTPQTRSPLQISPETGMIVAALS